VRWLQAVVGLCLLFAHAHRSGSSTLLCTHSLHNLLTVYGVYCTLQRLSLDRELRLALHQLIVPQVVTQAVNSMWSAAAAIGQFIGLYSEERETKLAVKIDTKIA
jgi:hypothetical protein